MRPYYCYSKNGKVRLAVDTENRVACVERVNRYWQWSKIKAVDYAKALRIWKKIFETSNQF